MLVKHFGDFEKAESAYLAKTENTQFKLWLNRKILNIESNTETSEKGNAVKVLQTYNNFLEELTGYSSKERRKKAAK